MYDERVSEADTSAARDARIQAITRPAKGLLISYAIRSLAGLFLAPLIFVPLFFKYHTLRYKIDEEGISASWGILFRREIYLTYKRIQDIHVNRDIIERWLGLAKVELQTASGSSAAELALEGMTDYEAVRDYLYSRMRGHGRAQAVAPGEGTSRDPAAAGQAEVLGLLRDIRGELEATRALLESGERGVDSGATSAGDTDA